MDVSEIITLCVWGLLAVLNVVNIFKTGGLKSLFKSIAQADNVKQGPNEEPKTEQEEQSMTTNVKKTVRTVEDYSLDMSLNETEAAILASVIRTSGRASEVSELLAVLDTVAAKKKEA